MACTKSVSAGRFPLSPFFLPSLAFVAADAEDEVVVGDELGGVGTVDDVSVVGVRDNTVQSVSRRRSPRAVMAERCDIASPEASALCHLRSALCAT